MGSDRDRARWLFETPGGGGNLSARGGKRFLVRCTACGRARWENRKNGQVEIYGWHWPTFPAEEGGKT